MKKLLFSALAAVALLASCQKENGNDNLAADGGEKAAVRVSLASGVAPGEGTRAYVNANDDDRKFDNFLFITVNGTGKVMKVYGPFTTIGFSNTTEFETTTLAKKIVAIGNTGMTGSLVDNIKAAATYADLQNIVLANPCDVINKVWMTDVKEIDFSNSTSTAADGESKLLDVSITMKLIPSKINVKVINNMTNYGQPQALAIDGISVLYSAANTNLLPTATTPAYSFVTNPANAIFTTSNKYYRSGISGWTLYDDNNCSVNSYYNRAWTGGTSLGGNQEETFYVFPGGGAHSKFTIVTVHATLGGGGKRYFPLHFTASDKAGDILKNGYRYNVTLTLKGDAGEDGGGTPDPEEEVSPAFFTIEIDSAEWIPVPIAKEFQ